MQDRKEADVGPEVARIPGYLLQGFRTGAEQEVIEDLLVLQRQWGELVRQSKDNVDIGDGQKFTLPSHNPLVASAALTLWAMTITATVIGGGAIATARALVAMPAECGGTATRNRAQYFPMSPMEPAEVAVDEAIALGANDIGQLQPWPSHCFCSLREGWISPPGGSGRLSRGLGTACKCLWERCR